MLSSAAQHGRDHHGIDAALGGASNASGGSNLSEAETTSPPALVSTARSDWVSDDESAADAARREAVARDLCASDDEAGYTSLGRTAPSATTGRTAAAVRDWLQMIRERDQISELARERFVQEGTDEAELGRIRRKLEGPPKQCNQQLEELRDRYRLRTLGERCRFLAALDEFMVS
jgi:hypothetical protein